MIEIIGDGDRWILLPSYRPHPAVFLCFSFLLRYLYLLSYYGMYFNHVQNTETVKIMSSTKQEHDDLQRAKYQLETELENLRREKSNVVRPASDIVLCWWTKAVVTIDLFFLSFSFFVLIRWISSRWRWTAWTKNCWSKEQSLPPCAVLWRVKRR